MIFLGQGYLLNHDLLTKLVTCWEVLLNISLLVSTILPTVFSTSVNGSSIISNQLLAVSIMVRHIKSSCVSSLPLGVHGHIRSTYNASQGLLMTNLVGSFPYFSFVAYWSGKTYRFLWILWPYRVMLARSLMRIKSPLVLYALGAVDSGGTTLQLSFLEALVWLVLGDHPWEP